MSSASASAPLARHRSLLRRTFGYFSAVLLLVWCVLMGREIHDIKVVHARNGQAWNHVWAEHVRLQCELWAAEPERLEQVLQELERLRSQEWDEMGYEPPIIALQVWHRDRMIYRQAADGLGADRQPPNEARLASDDHWLYVEAEAPAQDIVVRRWQEMPGDWHFSIQGLSYYARPLFYSLPLMLLVAWLLLRSGLEPLRRIGEQIGQRSARDLTPLPPTPFTELSPVVQGVNELMARLQERLEREREFLLDAAHELKTPLAVMQLNAEALQLKPAGPARDAAGLRLLEGVRRASHTVHQLLALARSGADQEALDIERHDLVALVRDRIALASQLALPRGIEIELHAPEHCPRPMHRESLGALIDNLVDNAIKYSPDGSLIRVEILPETADGGPLILRVSDSGPGIPTKLRSKVFERFYRLPGQNQAGSGLGLAIVERAAARHDATVHLSDAAPGGGLCVEVRFG